MLVKEWPVVIGVDASGIIVEAGKEAQEKYNMRPGTYVCGCTRIGMKGYAAGQEYFLMDAQVAMPKPSNITTLQAATLGVGIETAACAIFQGLHIDIADAGGASKKDEWAVVLGGASSVGWYGVQLLRAAGFDVVASCSASSADAIKDLGASTFDYNSGLEDQLKAILDVTGGKVSRVFDAVAMDDPVIIKKLFEHDLLKSRPKFFATTNDWSGTGNFNGGETYRVELGPIGRPEATDLNDKLAVYIPVLVKLIESGRVKVGDYELVGEGGFEDIVSAYKYKAGGTSGLKKVIAKVQEE